MKTPNYTKNFINCYKNPIYFVGSLGSVRRRILALNEPLHENDQLPRIWIKLLEESKEPDKYKFLRDLVPQTKDKNNIPTGKYSCHDLLRTFNRSAGLIQDKFAEIDAMANKKEDK